MASLEPDVIAALSRQVPKLTRNNLEKETRRKFKELKCQMISEFLALPVTQEIMAGPN